MMHEKEIEFDARDLLKYLKTKWLHLFIAVVIAFSLTFGAASILRTPTYESQSMIYITSGSSGANMVQNMLSSLQAGNALTADYKTLATSKPVLEQVIRDLKLDTDYEELSECVSTENPDNTRILILKVEDKDPKLAKKIVDKLTEIEVEKIANVMNTTPPNVMQWGDLQKEPVSDSPLKTAGYAAFVVLLLALIFYSIEFILNDTITTPEDIERILDLRNLAEIPYIPGDADTQEKGVKKWRK